MALTEAGTLLRFPVELLGGRPICSQLLSCLGQLLCLLSILALNADWSINLAITVRLYSVPLLRQHSSQRAY